MAKKPRAPTPQDEAFLQSIIESPDDDAPRLIYADWLDDHGDKRDRDRAEFIRVQCQLAVLNKDDPPIFRSAQPTAAATFAMHERFDEQPRHKLSDREFALFRKHGDAWAAPVSAMTFWRAFHRGFVEQVTVGVVRFFKDAEALFAAAPVRYAKVMNIGRTNNPEERLAALLTMPSLSRLAGLDLANNNLGPEGVQQLCGSPHLTGLTSLGLPGNGLGASGVKALARFPALPRLTALNLGVNGLDLAGARALVRLPALAGLKHLALHGNSLEDKGVQELVGSPQVAQLRSLDLRFNGIGGDGLRALAESPYLDNLTWLELGHNRIDMRRKEHKALVARFGKALRLEE
jgi:uncharacterized protein (TIGR02996 family)